MNLNVWSFFKSINLSYLDAHYGSTHVNETIKLVICSGSNDVWAMDRLVKFLEWHCDDRCLIRLPRRCSCRHWKWIASMIELSKRELTHQRTDDNVRVQYDKYIVNNDACTSFRCAYVFYAKPYSFHIYKWDSHVSWNAWPFFKATHSIETSSRLPNLERWKKRSPRYHNPSISWQPIRINGWGWIHVQWRRILTSNETITSKEWLLARESFA